MDLTELQELSVFQSRDQTQHTRLFAVPQVILKPDEAVRICHEIFLPELHARVWFTTGLRIGQTFRLHRTESQRVDSAARDLLDRQTRFEPTRLFKSLQRYRLRFHQLADEALVLLA